MTRINTNVSAIRGLRNLNKSNEMLNTSLTRLSTGLQINSGKDNPSGLIANETLRSQITSIEQSIKNSNRANNVIATADAALGEVNNLLDQIRGLVQESMNSGAMSQTEIEANQLQVDAALSAINRISANTNFAGDRLIDGSKAFITKVSRTDAAKLNDMQINEAVLNGRSLEINASITQVAEKAELNYLGGALGDAATVEIGGSKGSQVLFLGGASSGSDIRNAINAASDATGVEASFDPGLTFELGATQGFADLQTGSVANQIVLDFATTTTSTLDTLTFTDARANDTQGTNASLGGTVRIEIVDTNTSSTSTLGISSIQQTTTGTLITIELGNDASGAPTSTIADIVALINSGTSANAVEARNYISAAGASSAVASVTAATGLSGGADSTSIKFEDNRNEGAGGSAATLGGQVSVQMIEANTSDATLSVANVTTDNNGNTTIQISLGRASGANTSTVADILALINNGTSANAVTARSFVSATASSAAQSSTNLFAAQTTATQLQGGNDGLNNDLTFNDIRAYGTEGTINVEMVAGSASAELSISVTETTTGNSTVSITLATDEFGNITTTAAEIRDLLRDGTTDGAIAARALVDLDIEGNGSEAVAVQASAEVDPLSSILRLTSTKFGEKEFVSIHVLGGSFDTTDSDLETESQRSTGQDLQAVINGQVAQTSGLTARIKTNSLDAQITFNESSNVAGTRAQITVTGGGSLFQIGQEVSSAGQIGVGIEAVNTARLGGISGKLYELGTGAGKSLLDVGPNVPGSTLVNIVEEAINRVSTLRGRLGAIQKNVIDTNINSLGVALENISEARSFIVDTDFAVETANLTKSQVLAQSGIAVLGIANQTPSMVMSLLG